MRFSVLLTPVIVGAVLHKEFVRPKPDKLLGPLHDRRDVIGRDLMKRDMTKLDRSFS
jgi:hypothetical protein